MPSKLTTLPPVTQPPQEAVDSVASFIETAEDLAGEPFMSEDESRGFSIGADNSETYELGDRTHFRSALISFRRLWMQKEPSYYGNVCDCLFKHNAAVRPWTDLFRSNVDRTRRENSWFIPNITNEALIDLWINTVFAHSGLKQGKGVSRNQFDTLAKSVGLGKFEYSFRMAVCNCSLCLINLCKHAARPALEEWAAHGFKPSFQLSSPFGRQMKERLPDGTIIIRQASSKYYTEESLDRRFFRVLKRKRFPGIQFIFENIDATITGKFLLAIKADGVRNMLAQVDYSVEELPSDFQPTIKDGDNLALNPTMNLFKAFSGIAAEKDGKAIHESIAFGKDYKFYANKCALSILDDQLSEFVRELTTDD